MKEDIKITVIVPKYEYVQIYTHGCHYTRITKLIDGEPYFQFKGIWYRVADYTTPDTYINNIGTT